MTYLSFLRRSKTGLAGGSTHVPLALLTFVGPTTLLILGAGLTATSRGLFGHGHISYPNAAPS